MFDHVRSQNFDENAEGEDIALNWSLVDESVIPKNMCFGNLSTKVHSCVGKETIC